MDSKLRLKAPWPEVREKLKEVNIDLTDEDLDYAPGREEELLSRLGRKLNKKPEDVKDYIESVASNKSKAG